jgi:hypothetical protein
MAMYSRLGLCSALALLFHILGNASGQAVDFEEECGHPSEGLSLLALRTQTLKAVQQSEDSSAVPEVKAMHIKAHHSSMPEVAWRAFEALADQKRALLEEGSKEGANPRGSSVFEAVEVSLPLEPPVLKHSRNFGAGQGDKNIVGLSQLTRGGRQCIVYGIGIADDSSFEQQMQNLGCETHAFDCTIGPSAPAVAGRSFKFHNWCIGQKGNVSFKSNVYLQTDASMEFKTLTETMHELGHSHVDLLKFDIEGFEWQLFQSQILDNTNPPEQLSFELHTQKANPAYVPRENTYDKGYVQVNKLFRSLHDMGYRVTSKEINSGDPACAEFIAVKVGNELQSTE